MRLFLQITFFSLLLPGTAFCEDSESRLSSDSFLITARAFGDDHFEGIYYEDSEKKNRLLKMNPTHRTPIHVLKRGTSRVSFFKIVADGRNRESKQAVAMADLSGIESRALLIFLYQEDPVNNLPYTVLVADESPGKFKPGQLRFLNLCGPPLLGRLGEATFPLEFGFGSDFNFEAEQSEEMPIEFAVRVAGGWKIVYSAGFRPNPNIATLALIKPPKRVDSLRIQVEYMAARVYPEWVGPESEAPQNED